MKLHARVSLLALICALIAVLAPAAAQASSSVGIERFIAINCSNAEPTYKECGSEKYGPYSIPKKEVTVTEAEKEGYVQAGGHVPWGITDFKVTTVGPHGEPVGTLPEQIPTGVVTHIRTDVAPGLATSPAAVPTCTMAEFDGKNLEEQRTEKEVVPGFYLKPECNEEEGKSTKIGVNEVTVFAEGAGDVPLTGKVYNLEQPKGLASDYGVALEIPIPLSKGDLEKGFAEHPIGNPGLEKLLEEKQYYAHTLIEGNVEWGKEAAGTGEGDYHDYFNINVSPALPLIASRLVFNGRSGAGDFITNATSCPGHNTTKLTLTGKEGPNAEEKYTTPIALSGCSLLEPFAPNFSLEPETTASDQPDGFSATVTIPQHPGAEELSSSQLKTAVLTLPEGMTLDPSAATGLEACTPVEARLTSTTAGTSCPPKSELGTVNLEVPTLPPGSLTGTVYLGGPETGPITAPPYTIYVDAESARYGVSVRVEGEVIPNEVTGQLTTVFKKNPEQPFTSLTMHFKKGALAPIANPLACGEAKYNGVFTPFASPSSTTGIGKTFTVDSNGSGGSCSSPLPFAPVQSTADANANAGAHTSYAFTLTRPEGNQYLSLVKTQLPKGLVGAIPLVPLCTETQATSPAGCPAESLIGTATVTSGSGGSPFVLKGSVYLTEKYNGAPYGMYISVPVVAGPFNLGYAITRAGISVNPSTGQVIVSSQLPSVIKGGILPRLRSVGIEINRANFLTNPTSCGTLATESVVTGLGAGASSATLSTPFQVGNCSALAFKPTFSAKTSGAASKKYGASLETTISEPAGESNIASVKVQLPIQLPSRGSTLEKACAQATFEVNPAGCSPESIVGSVRANTPVLPNKLTGLAYLVGHAGAAFPDLDLVLSEPNGVRVVLVGNTNIKNGITTTTFATTPDVPVSSITVSLPMGKHSALAANGSLCVHPLIMPTTIVGQNGTPFQQNTIIKAVECGVQVVGHKVAGNVAYITVKTPEAGRVSGGGTSLATVYRHLSRAEKAATIRVPLSRGGQRRGRPFRVNLRIGFVPSNRHHKASVTNVTVSFR